jgi:hypothetical protein
MNFVLVARRGKRGVLRLLGLFVAEITIYWLKLPNIYSKAGSNKIKSWHEQC